MSSVSCCKNVLRWVRHLTDRYHRQPKKRIAAGSETNHMFCHAFYSSFYVSVLMESSRRTVPDYWNIQYIFQHVQFFHFQIHNRTQQWLLSAHKIGFQVFIQFIFSKEYLKKKHYSIKSLKPKESQQYKLWLEAEKIYKRSKRLCMNEWTTNSMKHWLGCNQNSNYWLYTDLTDTLII